MMRRKSFAEQHPILLGLGCILAVGFIGAYWFVILPATLLTAGCYLTYRAASRRQHRRALTAWHADMEHWYLMQGDDRGVYGNYPPAI